MDDTGVDDFIIFETSGREILGYDAQTLYNILNGVSVFFYLGN